MSKKLLGSLKGVGEQEWRAFVDGITLSTNLLIQLLTLRYKRQRSILVNPQATIVTENTQLVLPEPLQGHSLIEYELIVVLYRKGEKFLQTLLIKTRGYPFVQFVTQELLATLRLTGKLTYKDAGPIPMDNGYLMFAFLDYQLGDRPSVTTLGAKQSAAAMVRELEKPHRVRENLNAVYRDLNALLLDDMATSETQKQIETKKQHFFQLVENALDLTLNEMPVLASAATSFLRLEQQVLDHEDELTQDYSDTLFKEIQALLQFMLLVAKTSPSTVPSNIELRGAELRPDEVARYVRRTTNRILIHVDELNVRAIDTTMEKTLGFSQADYEGLISKKPFIPCAIMRHVMMMTGISPLMQVIASDEANPQSFQRDKRLLICVTESFSHSPRPEPYYSVAIVTRVTETEEEAIPVYQQSIYMPSHNVEEMREARNRVQKRLLEQVGIVCFKREIITSDNESMSAYHFTTWYTGLLIRRLSDAISQCGSCKTDWTKQADLILKSITKRQLFSHAKHIIVTVQQSILALLYPITPPPQQQQATTPTLLSRISDIARLLMTDEYIDNQVVQDTMAVMTMRTDCYAFDVTYWQSVKTREDVFKDPSFTTVLIPLNLGDERWALAIVGLTTRTIQYFGALTKEEQQLMISVKESMPAYMALQTPGITYKFVDLYQDVPDSVDCALYVLNKMRQYCVTPFGYTRESIAGILKRRLSYHAQKREWSIYFADDACRFFLSDAELWPSVKKTASRRTRYRNNYRRTFADVLAKYGKGPFYTTDSLIALYNRLTAPDLEIGTDCVTQVSEMFESELKETSGEIVAELFRLRREYEAIEGSPKKSFFATYDKTMDTFLSTFMRNVEERNSLVILLFDQVKKNKNLSPESLKQTIHMYMNW